MKEEFNEQQIAEGKIIEIGTLIKSSIEKLEFYKMQKQNLGDVVEKNIDVALEKLKKAFEKTGIKVEREGTIKSKEEQKYELLNFAFDEQNASSDWNIDKFSLYDKNLHTYSTNTTNGLWTTGYSKPTVQLKYVCNLTQKDVDYLRELLHLVYIDIESIKHVPSKEKYALDKLTIINNYISNSLGVRDKANEKQLEELIEQFKPKKSYEGTLAEHWKELSELFYIKSNFEHWEKLFNDVIIPDLRLYGYVCPRTEFNIYYYKRANDVYNSLGIDFIKDFIKACEKCEKE